MSVMVKDRKGRLIEMPDVLFNAINDALADVRIELYSAMTKHRSMASGHEGYAVILEEVDELWEHVKDDTWASTMARKEALQVAAMGVRYALDVCPITPD